MSASGKSVDRATPIYVAVATAQPKAYAHVRELQYAIEKELSARRLKILSHGRTGPIRTSVEITKARTVSRTQRIFFGAFMGQAEIVVSVAMIDDSSGDPVGSFTAGGKSSGGSIFGGTTEQAIEQVAIQVADYIETHYISN